MFDTIDDEKSKNFSVGKSLLEVKEASLAKDNSQILPYDDNMKLEINSAQLGAKNKYSQTALISEVLAEKQGQLDNGIKYVETECNLGLPSIYSQNLDMDRPFESLHEIGKQVKDVILFDEYVREVQKIGEDVARYKWAYDEGKFGEFDGGKFAKETLKAGARSFGSSSLSVASNMLKFLGTNINENTGLGIVATLGGSLVLPDAGKALIDLGNLLEKYAINIENLEVLAPDEDVYKEDPNWMSVANIVGQGSGTVLAMGGASKFIGPKATYGLFAIGGSGDVFNESIEKDGDVNKANLLTLASAGATYAIDRWFNPLPEHLNKGVKVSASKIAKEMLGAPLREAGSEALQQIMAENLVRKVGIDDTQLLFEGLIESAIGGMTGSFVVSGTSGSLYLADKAYRDAEKRIMLKGVSKEELELYKTSMLEFIKSKPEAFDKILKYNLTQNMREIVKNIDDREQKKLVKKDLSNLPKIYDEVYERMLKVTENEGQAKAMARMFQANALFFQQVGGNVDYLKMMEGYLPQIDKTDFMDFVKNEGAKTSNFQFIGVGAKNIDFEKIAEFEFLEQNNVDPQTLWKHTGFIRGKDGKLRFEISDEDAKLKLWENYEYEDSASIFQRELIHDLELLQAQIAYFLKPKKRNVHNTIYQDFYQYLKDHDSQFEDFNKEGDFYDPYINLPQWLKVIDEGIELRREHEELLLSSIWDDYEKGLRDFDEEGGLFVQGVNEKKRFDEFVTKYWKTRGVNPIDSIKDEIKKGDASWVENEAFLNRLRDLSEEFKVKRAERKEAIEASGILDSARFFRDLDVEETYKIHLALGKDIVSDRPNKDYRPSSYHEAYRPATMGEKFLNQAQYDFIDNDVTKKVLETYLDNIERYYRLERYLNFAKNAEKDTNIRANKSLNYGAKTDTDKRRLLISNGKEFLLGDVLEHKTLFDNYPDLKNTKVRFTRLKKDEPYHFYLDDSKDFVFEIDAEQLDTSMLVELLLKGTNFAIQQKEGFDYTLTDNQRKNYMDRFIYMAKKNIEIDAKNELERFLVRKGLIKDEKEVSKYWKESKMPVSLLNIYNSESADLDAKKEEVIKFGEVDFEKLYNAIDEKFPKSLDVHEDYIRRQILSDFYWFREYNMRSILYEARLESGYIDIGLPWAGLVTQGKNDDRALLKHRDHQNYLERDPFFSTSSGLGDGYKMEYKGDVMRNIFEDEVQYNRDEKAVEFIGKEAAKGAYDFQNNIIHLFKGADQETIIHETFHYFYDFLEKNNIKNNMALDNIHDVISDIKIEFLKNYKIQFYNGKYYATYKDGMGVLEDMPLSFSSKSELLDTVSKEIFVERLLRVLDGKPVNITSARIALLGGPLEYLEGEEVNKSNSMIRVDNEDLVEAGNVFLLWLKFMMGALDIKDSELSEGGKKIKKTLWGKKK